MDFFVRPVVTNSHNAKWQILKVMKMKNTLSTIAGISLFSFVVVNAAIAQEITASRLYTEFEKNEIAAEGKYKGTKINVSGKVVDVKKNIAGQPLITLDAGTLSYVSCRFPKNAMNELAKVQKDDNVKLSCKVDHKTLTTIHLSDCIFN